MPTSLYDFPVFTGINKDLLRKGANFVEPAFDSINKRPLPEEQANVLARGRIDAMVFWCGGPCVPPYHNNYDNKAWSAAMGQEIDDLSRWGKPFRKTVPRLR
jgi:hypothetical protein